jgi:hypothetical protein
MSRIAPVTAASRRDLPAPCVSCVFWQHDRAVTDERRKEGWSEAFERRHGSFGRVLSDDGAFRGMIQYGPASAFPRALALPAGPPDARAALITCVFLEGGDPAGVAERLMLEALADLKARDARAVEAFGLNYPDSVPAEDRFQGHHTLFDREFLEGLGFRRVRARGQVTLMRLELAGIEGSPGWIERAARLVRSAPAAATDPAPA